VDFESVEEEEWEEPEEGSKRKPEQKESESGSKIPAMLILALLLGAIAGALAGIAVQSLFGDADEATPITIKDDNVGIGTATPDSKLDVEGVISAEGGNSDEWNQAYNDALKWNGQATDLDPVMGRTSLGLGSMSTEDRIHNGNWDGPSLSIANGGTGASNASEARENLGLGLIAEQDTINNDDWSGTQLTISNGGTGATNSFDARTNLGINSGGSGDIWVDTTGDTMTGVLTLLGDGLVAGTDQLVLSSGNVGIGTATPVSKLDVNGVITATGGYSNLWNTAYGWGDHSTVGYIVTETDPIFGVSVASGISNSDITNWNSAYGWGDHSLVGYLVSETDPEVGANALNYTPKWNGQELVNGSIYDNGKIGIGTSDPDVLFDVEQESGPLGTVGGAATIGYKGNSATGDYAIAVGFNTNASGRMSTAMGAEAIASGDQTISLGTITNASGFGSTALGFDTTSSGMISTAMGYSTEASGRSSTAMGELTVASGYWSTAYGYGSVASGNYSTAGGYGNTASGESSTAMGYMTTANGNYTTAMGYQSTANADLSTAIGCWTTASGTYSTAIGRGTASGVSSIAMGGTASGWYSISMGYGTTASGTASTAMGQMTTASGLRSTAMGIGSTASGEASTAMGESTNASGLASTSMGGATTAGGDYSIATGYNTTASGHYSTSMGRETTAIAIVSTAMGYNTSAKGAYSTAMGYNTVAQGLSSTSMGTDTTATGASSTAMGDSTRSSGWASTTMGIGTTASGWASTAMGWDTIASGKYSVTMGRDTTARGDYSMAMGSLTNASGLYSTVLGHSINSSGNYTFGIGLDSTYSTITQDNTMTIMGGNVGIGTVNPMAPLMIVGNGDTLRVNGDTSPGGIHIAPTPFANGWWLGTGTGAPSNFIVRDAVQGLDRLVIDVNGNVGIGVASPSSKLHVNGEIRAERYIDRTNPAFFVDPGAPWSGEFSGDFGIGYGSASDDDDIGFDQGAEYLRWDDGADYFTFSNDLDLPFSLDVSGHTYLGDASTDNIVVNGGFASSLLPSSTNTYDLGDGAVNWRDVYAQRFRDGDNPSYLLDPANGGTSLTVAGNVGIGTPSPQGALDIQSTTGALIVPRMNTGQRDALSAQNGMIIFNTSTGLFNFYEAGAWVTK
jgi:hypothetical protein